MFSPIKDCITQLRFDAKKFFISYPKNIICNICCWSGARLISDQWHKYSKCPDCGSEVRHRLLQASLSELSQFSYDKLIDGKKVLHFAPERVLSEIFNEHTHKYIRADLNRDQYDLSIDISNMPEIQDCEFDTVIACDVLEHVKDDLAAMSEIHRILAINGFAILTVPQKDNQQFTLEDLNITSPEDRTKHFGQFDHLRIYGDDFNNKLENVGFRVTAVDEKYFDSDYVKKHVLFPPYISEHTLATNFRKVFFAQKHLSIKIFNEYTPD